MHAWRVRYSIINEHQSKTHAYKETKVLKLMVFSLKKLPSYCKTTYFFKLSIVFEKKVLKIAGDCIVKMESRVLSNQWHLYIRSSWLDITERCFDIWVSNECLDDLRVDGSWTHLSQKPLSKRMRCKAVAKNLLHIFVNKIYEWDFMQPVLRFVPRCYDVVVLIFSQIKIFLNLVYFGS